MKQIKNSRELRSRILSGVDLITEPVVQTLSPKGKNVLFEDAHGGIFVTNDGVTIAKQIESEDPVEDAIIRVIKYAALETNRAAGDGTTTTTLLASNLIKAGYKKIDDGMNEMELRKELMDFSKRVTDNLKPIKVVDDAQLLSIAAISSNNDSEVAENVLKVVKAAGESGLVFINQSPTGKTEVIEDTGYVVNTGLFAQELANDGVGRATYENVHVLVTDKRIYYEEECQSILAAALENGIQNLVIVARDFIGKAPNFLMANHINKFINLLLVKLDAGDRDLSPIHDLATFLGGEAITEKSGKLVGKVTAEDFIIASKVYATRDRSVFQTVNPYNPKLIDLIEAVKKEKDAEPDNKEVERRLSSLTNGVVTVNVGGATQIEVQENIYRYEDSINATRSALRDGYLVGGGLALYAATREETDPMYRKFGESSLRQIARNCGKHEDYILSMTTDTYGYNAKTDEFEDLLSAGVIDPYEVTKHAIVNATSVAIAVLTSGFIIVNQKENATDTK